MGSSDRVLVAGAGPVGLVVATYLAKNQVPVTLVETKPELGHELRASTVHPPTLDMMEEFGITEQIIVQGLKAPTWQFRDRHSGAVATFDLGVLTEEDTRHPYRVQCEQWKICHLLYDKLKDMASAEVLFGPTSLHEIDVFDLGERIAPDLDCLVCYKTDCDFVPNCMASITTDQVHDAVMRCGRLSATT